MATSLATARTDALTALSGITTANKYRRRPTNPQFPCLFVGWPDEFDFNPTLGAGERDFTLSVWAGCEVTDDESSDDALSSLLESAVTALQVNPAWRVAPATDFGEQVTDDNRTIIWARLPLLVLA